ncbi:DNA-binding response OmpR family regulator [Bacillus oleivorans]|uniref:DNA-binding response OmpR family regulator n=1 Tax=Bacillus oleivorans TaxID=1448271 RepID=A0A285CGH9_9BACI|nr:response regulator transcription factor [Bacillus oleivorans]SNX66712.1 DNA-binding response OmpR family regulator [Bacillus oleivorans]
MKNILIVEDDQAISNLIYLNLNVAGYKSTQVYSSNEALTILKNHFFDLILLDVMLPDMDGFELIEKIRTFNTIPVIFITAKNDLPDKVKGLKIGAEDYIVKPFEAMELLARIEVVLRRYSNHQDSKKFEDLEINEEERIVRKNGQIIDLTLKEYELLLLLVRNRNKALTREKILELVWGYDYLGETRTVDIHIQKLRKKLNWTEKIITVYKFGYRLESKH